MESRSYQPPRGEAGAGWPPRRNQSKPNMAKKKRTVPVIGLAGGIAAGKSYVARLLAERGATVIDADAIGHELVTRPLVIRSIANAFGPGVLDPAGRIDRSRLAGLVFGTDELSTLRRKLLESIVHPAIHADVVRMLRRAKDSKDPPPMVVIDAPLLLESGWNKMCDLVLFVDAPRELRLRRAHRRGWSDLEFANREAAQRDVDWKRSLADVVIQSVEDPQEMARQIDELVQQVTES
ncbi:MAG: dephospho-CoA kinase [Planctomycetota bacterium]|nr:MAG: dephospho-CoA kinase [Planctomycetota bacterium]